MNDYLLTTNQLAKACGISRSTVLRMEERNLIKPSVRPTSSSSRLYDMDALFRTHSVLLLQQLDLESGEIQDFLQNDENYNVIRFYIYNKIKSLLDILDVIDSFTDSSNNYNIKESKRAGITAWCEEITLTDDWSENPKLILDPLFNAIKRGYSIDWNTPLGIAVSEKDLKLLGEREVKAYAFIPINPITIRFSERNSIIRLSDDLSVVKDGSLVSFEDAYYSTLIWHGDPDGIEKAFDKFISHIQKNEIGDSNYLYLGFYSMSNLDKPSSRYKTSLQIFKRIKPQK